MSRESLQAGELARSLIAAESRESKRLARELPAAFYVCELLRPCLANLMGAAGFRAVLGRALSLAVAGAPRLEVLEVKPDGSLGGWEKPEAKSNPKKLAESTVVLVAELLGLIFAFIGENLTLRLLREVWPALPVEAWNIPPGDHT